MTTYPFNLTAVHPSWDICLQRGLAELNPGYVKSLSDNKDWLPGPDKIFNAFSLPLTEVNYVLFGESPYPRRESANGYAFWDAAVADLWSSTGFSKKVNRATSLRNILKMLLIAEGLLQNEDTSQAAIAKIDKHALVQTNNEFFNNLLAHGFLLLNATPILQANNPAQDARAWHAFINQILLCLLEKRPKSKFILLGRVASIIDKSLYLMPVEKLCAEHPYNLSFITNPQVLAFFKPLHLLRK